MTMISTIWIFLDKLRLSFSLKLKHYCSDCDLTQAGIIYYKKEQLDV